MKGFRKKRFKQPENNKQHDCVLKSRYSGKDRKTSWVWSHFQVLPNERTFAKPTGEVIQDTDIICNHQPCSFSTTEQKRQGATSNLARHLFCAHQIKKCNEEESSIKPNKKIN